MFRCVNDVSFLQTAHSIYVQHHKFPETLTVAIKLGDPALIREDFTAPTDETAISITACVCPDTH
ncbi:hypothetical protein B0H11DRAFT_1951475 [Mycena galericulata]|nr:hypothetical protein B0H11DRAFT_1951475 [Mycena galericulata]